MKLLLVLSTLIFASFAQAGSSTANPCETQIVLVKNEVLKDPVQQARAMQLLQQAHNGKFNQSKLGFGMLYRLSAQGPSALSALTQLQTIPGVIVECEITYTTQPRMTGTN
jgi:hypothetical protein